MNKVCCADPEFKIQKKKKPNKQSKKKNHNFCPQSISSGMENNNKMSIFKNLEFMIQATMVTATKIYIVSLCFSNKYEDIKQDWNHISKYLLDIPPI